MGDLYAQDNLQPTGCKFIRHFIPRGEAIPTQEGLADLEQKSEKEPDNQELQNDCVLYAERLAGCDDETLKYWVRKGHVKDNPPAPRTKADAQSALSGEQAKVAKLEARVKELEAEHGAKSPKVEKYKKSAAARGAEVD